MNILVFSDSHTTTTPMLEMIRTRTPDLILHLGDHDRDTKAIARAFPQIPLRVVQGNCDFGQKHPLLDDFIVADCRIIMTHGHRYNVKLTYDSILNMGHVAGADILLFGHTHIAYYEQIGDMHVLNPGSAGMGGRKSCGLIQITDGEIRCAHLPL